MTDDFLKSCKKCFIKTIISPGMFLMSEYNKGNKYFKNQLKHLEFLLAKECRTSLESGQVFIGQIIAVENNLRFFRGLIIDFYNKKSEYVYEILLIDYGNIIKCCGSKIFMITNKQLKDRKWSAFKIVLHGVQPLTLDINDHNNITNGIFQKRISSTWSIAALRFIESQLNIGTPVYVKAIDFNDGAILGEIYIIKEPGGEAKSLSQILCENDFAIFWEDSRNSSLKNIPEGTLSFNNIEDKIPTTAMSRRMKNFNIYKNYLSRYENHSPISLNSKNFSVQSLVKPILDIKIQESEFSGNSSLNVLEEANSKDSEDNSSNKSAKLNSPLVSRKIKHYLSFSSLDSAAIDQSDLNRNDVSSLPKNHNYSIFALVKRRDKLLTRDSFL